ncbi:kinase-like domain-containing protein [Gautieria morchelliformis]|nr:kinase-like domain-containing protein [Gautieria morchelliformis]
MSESSFDVIPYEDIKGNWTKLGSGSFGNVYKGMYLGIDVAIKEVLPSSEYDVAKYFEREWRLMKEARHPNVVLYLGLSRAPDGRIFIVSEYIENGNLRLYIHDKAKPFPWRLRLSFATDICRALAYLHARKCIHRDLKGENLLLTANLRLKITDFGFARIAARNDSESRRLTFCGTDAYMSPEILLGTPFDLPTDLFSLGVVFSEIASRRLADDSHFARGAPTFGIDPAEVRRRASPGCPQAFVDLSLDCLKENPAERPLVKDVLERLRRIELEVLARPTELDDGHLGTVNFFTPGRRPVAAPRIPSFGVGVANDLGGGKKSRAMEVHSESDSDDEELEQAVMGLESVDLELGNGWGDAQSATQPLINQSTSSEPVSRTTSSFESPSDYSTTVVRAAPTGALRSSILTIRPPFSESDAVGSTQSMSSVHTANGHDVTDSMLSIQSYHTASGSMFSVAGATEGGSTYRRPADADGIGGSTLPTAVDGNDGIVSHIPNNPENGQFPPPPPLPALLHRFTLIKPGAKRTGAGIGTGVPSSSHDTAASTTAAPVSESPNTALPISNGATAPIPTALWSPFDFFFSTGLLVARCDLCSKRLGWKPVLECDDCGLR